MALLNRIDVNTLGTVSLEEVGPGLHMRLPFITNVRENK